MSLPALLRAARESAGLSMGAVARQVGCTTVFISDIEAGKRGPSVTTLERIGRVLGLDTDILIAAQGKLPPDLAVALQEQPALIRRVRAAMTKERP